MCSGSFCPSSGSGQCFGFTSNLSAGFIAEVNNNPPESIASRRALHFQLSTQGLHRVTLWRLQHFYIGPPYVLCNLKEKPRVPKGHPRLF